MDRGTHAGTMPRENRASGASAQGNATASRKAWARPSPGDFSTLTQTLDSREGGDGTSHPLSLLVYATLFS